MYLFAFVGAQRVARRLHTMNASIEETAMRVNLCRFIDLQGNDAFINPLQVRYFTSGNDGQHTTIFFDKEHSIVVVAAPQDVAQGLTMDFA